MRKLNFYFKCFIVTVLVTVLLSGCGLVYAKSENSGSPNSNSGKKEENSKSNKTNQGNSNNSGKSNDLEDLDKSNSGKSSDSKNSGPGSQNSGRSKSSGKGSIKLLDRNEDKVSTTGAKVKKLEKVLIKEASTSALGKRRAIQGLIASIDGFMINLVHQIQRDRTFQVLFNSNTLIKSKDATASATLLPGLRIVAVGDLNSAGLLVASRIHIIPGKATGIFKKNPIASNSASPSPTNTASPSATINPSP